MDHSKTARNGNVLHRIAISKTLTYLQMQMILLNGKADMEAVKFALGLKFAFGLSGLIHGRCL